jgi:hypothetical protein
MKKKIKSMSKTLTMSRSKNIAKSIHGGKRSKRRGGNPFALARIGNYFSNKSKKQPDITTGQTGGYSQYQNNYPSTPTYSTGGILSAQNLGLANPVPYKLLSNDTNNIDNYNHFTMKGFSSKGH